MMCRKFTVLIWDEVLQVIQRLEMQTPRNYKPDWPALPTNSADSFNREAFPGGEVCVITQNETGHFTPRVLTWGFVLSGHAQNLVFNTRVENAMTSSLWADSFLKRRCIVPAFSFYETHQSERAVLPSGRKGKQQYQFVLPDEIFLMAGIWDRGRFSILTCPPDSYLKPIHNRMPLLLGEKDALAWMQGQDALSCRAFPKIQTSCVYPSLPVQGNLELF